MAVIRSSLCSEPCCRRLADVIYSNNWNSKKYTSSCHSSYYYHRHYCFYSGYTTNVYGKDILRRCCCRLMTITDKKENIILINIESTSKEEEDHDEDPEELERITHNLRDELTEIDAIEKVDLVIKRRRKSSKRLQSWCRSSCIGFFACNFRDISSKHCYTESF